MVSKQVVNWNYVVGLLFFRLVAGPGPGCAGAVAEIAHNGMWVLGFRFSPDFREEEEKMLMKK